MSRRFRSLLALPFLALPPTLALLAGCESGKGPTSSARDSHGAGPSTPAAGAAKLAAAAPAVQHFGGAFVPGPEVALSALLESPTQYAGTPVTTGGLVKRACSNKGCWMEIAQGDGAGCRVTFKDYGFFVPTDSAGAQARVQGVLETEQIPSGRVRHLENEGARFRNKNADGSATEVTLVASAVDLAR